MTHRVDTDTNTLGTTRLVLRELTPRQVAGMLEQNAASGEWAEGYPLNGSRFAAQHFTERTPDELRPGFGMYHIVRRSDGLVIGDLGFHRPPAEDGTVEIGFGLAEKARGQGCMTEALTGLARWAFAQPGVSRITARTEPANTASQGVLERACFRLAMTQDDTLHYVLLPLPASEAMRDDEAHLAEVRELGEARKAGGDDLAFKAGTEPLRRVVRDGGRLLAYAQSGEKDGVEDDRDYLMYIVVHPDVARRGVATSLLAEIREHARVNGRTGLVTGTADEDAASNAWMRKQGFQAIGHHRITRRVPSAATDGAPAGLTTDEVDRSDHAAVEEFVTLATRTFAEAVMPGGAGMTANPDEIRKELVEDNQGPLLICRAAGRAAGWLALTPFAAGSDAFVIATQVLKEAADQGVPAALLTAATRLADQSPATGLMAVAEVDGQRELAASLKDHGFRKVAGRTIWLAPVDPASGGR